MGKSFEIFKQRNFLMYWIGYLFSAMGDAVFMLTIGWMVAELTGSGVLMGTMLLIMGIPRIGLMLLGGVMVDRFNPKRVMFLSDVLRAFVMFGLFIFTAVDWMNLYVLFVTAFVFGAVDAFYWPGVESLRQKILDPAKYVQANSILTGTWQTSYMVGPLIGGFLLVTAGFKGAYALIGLAFLVSAVTLYFIRVQIQQQPDTAQQQTNSILKDLLEGVRYVKKSPVLLTMIIVAMFANASFSTLNVGLPFLAKDFEAGAEGYSLMSASLGLGGLGVAILLALFIMIEKPTPRMVFLVTFLQASGIMLISLTGNHWQAVLFIAWIGAMGALLSSIGPGVYQRIVPPHMMGRVASFMIIVAQGAAPVSQAISGWFIDWWGVHSIFFIFGIVAMTAALISSFIPAVRNYRMTIQSGEIEG
ncbi:MAG: MFS transporter [Bacillaceae bacterium]|nr:MFS transporter [Bacillaceae bacterium]